MRRSSRAKREQRVIVTLDQDFGEIYYLRERGRVGVLVLRLRDQTVASVNRVLAAFFHTQAHDIDLDTSLVVVDEHQVRVVRDPALTPRAPRRTWRRCLRLCGPGR